MLETVRRAGAQDSRRPPPITPMSLAARRLGGHDAPCRALALRRHRHEPRAHLRDGRRRRARRRRARVVPREGARARRGVRATVPGREAGRRDERAILEDPSIQLVLSSIMPNERAPLGIRVMQHGKDYMVDKPGITTLAQLAEVRRVQAATKRIYSIVYSERFENGATITRRRAGQDGAIGKVIQTIGLGPHRIHPPDRPGVVLGSRALRRDHLRHRLAPVRPVSVLHRLDARRDRRVAGAERASSGASGVSGFRRRDGSRQRRHGLHARRLVHARPASPPGATRA